MEEEICREQMWVYTYVIRPHHQAQTYAQGSHRSILVEFGKPDTKSQRSRASISYQESTPGTMKSTLLLMAILVLGVGRSCQAVCEESQEQGAFGGGHSKKVSDLYQLHPSLLRRLYNSRSLSLDGLLRLLSKTTVDPKESMDFQKRDMHDFFVGLMGKRNIQSEPPMEVNQENYPGFGNPKYSTDSE
ncbi:tachykinin-3 [Dromiciops gliroides]|uniref:tachykinin-3 n=1 Tax=Dromiciops gliroides TaxID=33562 RepID=UPI001CC39661|nr:tachykinin-3 [Dromiciops gliroides]